MIRRVLKQSLSRFLGFDIERHGRSFALVNRKYRAEAWFSYSAKLSVLFRELDITMVLDVGANVGQFAAGLRQFYKGQIHSFEPVARTHAELALRAHGDPLWKTHHFALGSSTTTAQINISPSTDFNSLLTIGSYGVQRFGERVRPGAVESIAVRRLEDVMHEIAPQIARERIFLKMDTQGLDLEVFNGIGTAASSIVALQSEVSLIPIYEGMPHWTDSLARFEAGGFGVVGMFPVSTDNGHVIEYDCLMSRRDTDVPLSSPPTPG